MKTFKLIVFFLCTYPLMGQTLRLDLGTVYIQKKVLNETCTLNNGSKFAMGGIYTLSDDNFNGRNQYEKLINIADEAPITICVSRSFQSLLGIKKYFIRWQDNKWVAGIITNVTTNSFLILAELSSNTVLPKCGNSLTKSYIIGGNDCYCQASMTLTGTAPATTPRYSQTTLISAQTVLNATSVYYQAGNSISLENGFQVSSGGVFEAKIDTCD
jgi:hypothetical protein